MEYQASLEGIANQDSKESILWKRLINRSEIRPFLEDLKSLVDQVRSFPYQIPASFLGFTGGTELGERISRMFPVPPDRLLHDLGQKLQDENFGYIGAFALATLASVVAKHYGPRIGDYVQRRYKGNVNA